MSAMSIIIGARKIGAPGAGTHRVIGFDRKRKASFEISPLIETYQMMSLNPLPISVVGFF
jgi:hypothetical protein